MRSEELSARDRARAFDTSAEASPGARRDPDTEVTGGDQFADGARASLVHWSQKAGGASNVQKKYKKNQKKRDIYLKLAP